MSTLSTLTTLAVHEDQVRVDHQAARDALEKVIGQDLVSAIAKLRHGPGRTCEPLARVLDRAVANARQTGLDPTMLRVSAGTIEPAEDIVRVRRKAHGKADWISSVTSDISVELTPSGIYQADHVAAETSTPAASVPAPRTVDPKHPLVPALRELLLDVIDPDLGINIVDLGFVRCVAVENSTAVLTMTLTSAACPLTGVMEDQIRQELLEGQDPMVHDFRIDWEWTPAWTPAEISPEGREQLRAIGFTI
ncbi:MAG TPA: uL22 family ribosomal protein [Pseudonocardiaceae bacterium]|nr:uL22 family ribosomal protein [Pseudonocardiaceae bacterium]